ncbi:uncharacterized protein LOC135213692 isoform X4 [Macrobrachium nipponense]|uniref:uncharacterized protein LOC135213692 isoform X4 n=1 Tax=Macrobrachium nipponense TaxID=159736 RepID=UPI0030C89791
MKSRSFPSESQCPSCLTGPDLPVLFYTPQATNQPSYVTMTFLFLLQLCALHTVLTKRAYAAPASDQSEAQRTLQLDAVDCQGREAIIKWDTGTGYQPTLSYSVYHRESRDYGGRTVRKTSRHEVDAAISRFAVVPREDHNGPGFRYLVSWQRWEAEEGETEQRWFDLGSSEEGTSSESNQDSLQENGEDINEESGSSEHDSEEDEEDEEEEEDDPAEENVIAVVGNQEKIWGRKQKKWDSKEIKDWTINETEIEVDPNYSYRIKVESWNSLGRALIPAQPITLIRVPENSTIGQAISIFNKTESLPLKHLNGSHVAEEEMKPSTSNPEILISANDYNTEEILDTISTATPPLTSSSSSSGLMEEVAQTDSTRNQVSDLMKSEPAKVTLLPSDAKDISTTLFPQNDDPKKFRCDQKDGHFSECHWQLTTVPENSTIGQALSIFNKTESLPLKYLNGSHVAEEEMKPSTSNPEIIISADKYNTEEILDTLSTATPPLTSSSSSSGLMEEVALTDSTKNQVSDLMKSEPAKATLLPSDAKDISTTLFPQNDDPKKFRCDQKDGHFSEYHWQLTTVEVNTSLEILCPEGLSGSATWFCLPDGLWATMPDISNCSRKVFDAVTSKLENTILQQLKF